MQIDQEALNVLRQQIAAEQATADELKRKNDLTERTLVELQRNRMAEQQRARLAFDTADRVSGLAEALPQVMLAIHQINEWCREASGRLDRVDEILMLLLAGKSGNKARVEAFKSELNEEHDQRLLVQQHRNLQVLEEQAAGYGMDVPLYLINHIKLVREKIAGLEGRQGEDDA